MAVDCKVWDFVAVFVSWTWSHYIALADIELGEFLLPKSSECWD